MTDAAAPAPDDAVTETSAPEDPAATCTAGGTSADSSPAPEVVGRFHVLGQLARGGMGVVYRAHDPQFDREVAVKVLAGRMADRPDTFRRFLDEARITGQLQHPSVPPVHEAGTLPDGRPFLAMKLIKGRTLDDLFKERANPAVDFGRLLAVFEQVCQAVAYAHAHKVIHRDLKPANVMVGAFGEVQLMDWGLAKVLSDGPDAEATAAISPGLTEIRTTRDAESFTQAGSLLGTPAYMPPEQAAGSVEQTDERADVFGLGALLCVILTGQPPYIGATAETVRLMAVRGKVDEAFGRLDACGADPEFVALCKRCLAVERTDRPADARAVATAVSGLRAAAEERARLAEVDRAAAEVRVAEQWKRRKAQAALGLTFTALVACGCVFAWWQDRQAADRRADQARVDGERAADRAAAESRARQAVESGVHLAAEMRDKFRFSEATLALDQAAALVPTDGPVDVHDRLAAARADLAFVQELDRIRLSRIRESEIIQPQPLGIADTYAAAFRARGFDLTGPDAAGESDRVAASPIKRHLVAALDEWSWLESWRQDLSARNQLLAVARRVDPGPWSDQLRDPVFRTWGYERPERAAAMDRLAREADPDSIPPHLIALLFQLQGRDAWDAGRPLLLASALRYPDNFWVQFEVGYHFLHRESSPARAIGHLRAARALRPDQPFVLTQLAHALKQSNDLDGAIVAYREGVRLDPKNANSNVQLCFSLRQMGDLDGALAAAQEFVRVLPENGYAHAQLGWTHRERKEYDRAAACYAEVVRFLPSKAQYWGEYGLILADRGDVERAVAAFREAIRLDPKNAFYHNNLGKVLFLTKDYVGAIAACREAIRLDPKIPQAHINLGSALRITGDLNRAVAAFRDVIRRRPDEAQGHLGLGLTLRDQKDLEGAIASFREAIRLDPKNANTHTHLGVALARTGRPGEALREMTGALRTDSAWAENPRNFLRYNAACFAMLCAEGKGNDAPPPAERPAYRKQALDHLTADLAAIRKLQATDPARHRDYVHRRMLHWLQDTDLASVRERAALEKLPIDEQAAWAKLWTEVQALRDATAPLEKAPPPRIVK